MSCGSDAQPATLSAQQVAVLREGATEAPFSGKYTYEKASGVYRCAGCGAALFGSEAKFDSGSGWPSFTDPLAAEAVELREDRSHGMIRTEVVCRGCGGHLGHVFDDGPGGADRFCINSCVLQLEPSQSEPAG